MVKSSYIPDSGDVVYLDFNPVLGHEQKGRRPAVVISPKIYNAKSGLALVCPVTSKVKNYPFETVLPDNFGGVVLVDHIRSIDWKIRRAEYSGNIPEDVLLDIQTKLTRLIRPNQA